MARIVVWSTAGGAWVDAVSPGVPGNVGCVASGGFVGFDSI